MFTKQNIKMSQKYFKVKNNTSIWIKQVFSRNIVNNNFFLSALPLSNHKFMCYVPFRMRSIVETGINGLLDHTIIYYFTLLNFKRRRKLKSGRLRLKVIYHLGRLYKLLRGLLVESLCILLNRFLVSVDYFSLRENYRFYRTSHTSVVEIKSRLSSFNTLNSSLYIDVKIF